MVGREEQIQVGGLLQNKPWFGAGEGAGSGEPCQHGVRRWDGSMPGCFGVMPQGSGTPGCLLWVSVRR